MKGRCHGICVNILFFKIHTHLDVKGLYGTQSTSSWKSCSSRNLMYSIISKSLISMMQVVTGIVKLCKFLENINKCVFSIG